MEVMQQEDRQSSDNHNLLKLSCFLKQNTNHKPHLPSPLPIRQLLRQYLNDDDFTILRGRDSVFKDDDYEKTLERVFTQWQQEDEDPSDIDYFLRYWLTHQTLQIEYSFYDDLQQEKAALSQKSRFISELDEVKEELKSRQVPECLKKPLKLQQDSTRLVLLKHFFVHFCKKEVNNISSGTFDQYKQYYEEMNMTKWMNYVRDIGLSQFQKIITKRRLQSIFLKHQNNNQNLTFIHFQQAVRDVLTIIYPHDPTEGYELLGILNVQNFKHKYQQLGLFPPTLRLKPPKKKQAVSTLRKIRLQNQCTSKISIRSFDSLPLTKPSLPTSRTLKQNKTKLHPQPAIRSSIQNSVAEGLGKSSGGVPSSRRHLKMHLNQSAFQDAIKQEQQQDPYLKRYKYRDNVNLYHSIVKRIDDRIQKINDKY